MIAVAIFFVKMVRKSLFRPIKERRNDKPKTIQVSLQHRNSPVTSSIENGFIRKNTKYSRKFHWKIIETSGTTGKGHNLVNRRRICKEKHEKGGFTNNSNLSYTKQGTNITLSDRSGLVWKNCSRHWWAYRLRSVISRECARRWKKAKSPASQLLSVYWHEANSPRVGDCSRPPLCWPLFSPRARVSLSASSAVLRGRGQLADQPIRWVSEQVTFSTNGYISFHYFTSTGDNNDCSYC